MPQLTTAQRTEDWLAARKGRITASNAAACLGIHPYISRQKAWREITGNQTPAEKKAQEAGHNFASRWGQNFEAVARNAYEAETGNLVTETGFWVHPDLPWLGCSPDGLIGSEGGLEVKCPEILYGKVPHYYRIQCQVQMACLGRAWVDFFCWAKPNGQPNTKLWHIRRTGMMPVLIMLLKGFFDAYIATGIEPPKKRKKVKV